MVPKEWTTKYLAPLLGCTVCDVGVGWGGFPYIKLVNNKSVPREEYTIEVSRDEEGNGPGFLFGLPPVKEE